MNAPSKFVDQSVAAIAVWRGIVPPNETAFRMVEDLAKVIEDFETQRGTLRFEDEPSSFDAALREAASIEVVS